MEGPAEPPASAQPVVAVPRPPSGDAGVRGHGASGRADKGGGSSGSGGRRMPPRAIHAEMAAIMGRDAAETERLLRGAEGEDAVPAGLHTRMLAVGGEMLDAGLRGALPSLEQLVGECMRGHGS